MKKESYRSILNQMFDNVKISIKRANKTQTWLLRPKHSFDPAQSGPGNWVICVYESKVGAKVTKRWNRVTLTKLGTKPSKKPVIAPPRYVLKDLPRFT